MSLRGLARVSLLRRAGLRGRLLVNNEAIWGISSRVPRVYHLYEEPSS